MKAVAVGTVLCVLPPLFVAVFSDGPRLAASFQKLSRDRIVFSSCMVLVAWLCHSFRVQLMVRTLGYRCSWGYAVATAMAMEFGIAVTPGGVGGGAFKAAFLRKLGMPLSESLGLIATDILFDGFFFFRGWGCGHVGCFSRPSVAKRARPPYRFTVFPKNF